MKQLLDCTDIFIVAPFFLGYLWAADKFCKKFLGASKRREGLFLFFSFCGWLVVIFWAGCLSFRILFLCCCILYSLWDWCC